MQLVQLLKMQDNAPLRAHLVRYSHFTDGCLNSTHWNDVAPKTQIGHDTDNCNLTIFSPQVELEADRHHEQKKKTNNSL